MRDTVICPTCDKFAKQTSYYGHCECLNCGAEWNENERKRKEMARKRDDWTRQTGKRPPSLIFDPTQNSI